MLNSGERYTIIATSKWLDNACKRSWMVGQSISEYDQLYHSGCIFIDIGPKQNCLQYRITDSIPTSTLLQLITTAEFKIDIKWNRILAFCLLLHMSWYPSADCLFLSQPISHELSVVSTARFGNLQFSAVV